MEEATATIDALPDELLCHIIGMLPRGMVPVAARTCKRWFACSPARPRRFLCWRTLCGSVSLLQWGLRLNPPPFLTVHVCNWAAEQGQLDVLKWVRERQQQQQQSNASKRRPIIRNCSPGAPSPPPLLPGMATWTSFADCESRGVPGTSRPAPTLP